MKKTIITAALLLGAVSVATGATSDTGPSTREDFDLSSETQTTVGVWDTTKAATPSADTSYTVNKDTGIGTLTTTTDGALSKISTSSSSRWAESTITFMLDVETLADMELGTDILPLVTLSLAKASNDASFGNTIGLGLKAIDNENKLVLLWNGNAWNEASTSASLEGSSGIYSMLMEYSSGKPNTFYYDSGALNADGESAPIQLSTKTGLGGTNNGPFYLSSVAVDSNYVTAMIVTNAALSTEGLGKAAQYIPEPATATLSLLALAGLAARRRRK